MEFVRPSYARENKGHYSAGARAGKLLFISGQLSLDPDTGIIPEGGIGAHVSQALSNLDRVLVEAGLSRTDVVQCRIYTTDVAYWDEVNRVYAEFFGPHKPARAIVPVSALHHGCLVEIEAIAEENR